MDRFFSLADTDHNGQLSKAEFDAAKGPMMAGPEGRPPRMSRHPGKAPVPAPADKR